MLVCPLLQGARRSFCPFWPSAIASSICQATLLTFLSLDALLLQQKTWNWKYWSTMQLSFQANIQLATTKWCSQIQDIRDLFPDFTLSIFFLVMLFSCHLYHLVSRSNYQVVKRAFNFINLSISSTVILSTSQKKLCTFCVSELQWQWD